MPMQRLTLQPGINTEATQTQARGTWSKSNLIRFRDGYVEKRTGWTKLCNTALTGTCRRLHNWMDLDLNKYVVAGTTERLQLVLAGTLYDITPLRDTVNIAVSFDTTDTSTTVNITDASHGGSTGDTINLVVPVSIGGIILQGYYEITVVDTNNYTIESATPATATVSAGGAVPVFDTTMSSDTVQVTLADHGYVVGSVFTVQVSTSVGGLTIVGQYLVDTVIDPDTFTILADSSASSTATVAENGGNAQIEYLIPPGPVSNQMLNGWGTGTWGTGTWGVGTGSASFLEFLRYWSLDNFQLDLLACYNGGPIYTWTPPPSTGGRATLLTGDPPDYNNSIFVAMPQLQCISLGAEVLGTLDPLLIRWCDIGDDTVWTASATNQAGSYRLSRGSRIVGGLQASQSALVWTDSDLWQMQYIGLPYVYSFSIIAEGCGLIGPLAAGVSDRSVLWMTRQGFYTYGAGSVSAVPCSVWDTIFQDLDYDNADKIVCAPESARNEVTWFFPSLSGGTGEIDSYVKLNTLTGNWDYGPVGTLLTRTAWIDHNVVGDAVSVDLEKYIQQEDYGYDADDAAMTGVMAETGFIDIAEGEEMVYADQIIPDFKLLGTDPEITLTVIALDWPFGTPVEHGPYTIGQTTEFISTQIRCRQLAFRINCDNLDTWFRFGAPRVRTAPSGRVT